jgi:nicotinamide mononucleotide transporter
VHSHLEAVSSIEFLAVFLALVYLVLAAYQIIWCWHAAAISSILYIKICYDSQLFIETGLQVFYLIMAIIGYINWKKNSSANQTSTPILNLSQKQWIYGCIICSVISIIMAYWFQNNTVAKLPWLDAPVTIFSIWATWLVIKKVLENWLLWIMIDAVAIYIYAQRNLNFTALLYTLYTILAIIGYFKWKKVQRAFIKLP